MRNLKKFLALVLAMMMAFSMVLTASATSIDKDGKPQSFNDTTGVEFLTAIEVLNGMNVLKGDANPATGAPTGNFRPTDTITRAEVAALVYRLATGDTTTNAEVYAQYGNFSDVKDDAWYAGYVGYCANAGYIKGYAGEYGPFGPTDNVTGYQALAMILRAVGYGVNGEFEGGSWQLNVASIGNQRGVLKGINKTHFKDTLQQPAQRQVVAEIFFQAAQISRVVYTPAFGYETVDAYDSVGIHDSLGHVNFGLKNTQRIVVGNQATGESATVLGPEKGGTIAYNDSTTTISYSEYAYPGSLLVDDVTPGTVSPASAEVQDNERHSTVVVPVSVGLRTDLVSGLELFGHKIDLWYNDNNGHAYAYYDNFATDKLVWATDATVSNYDYQGADDTNDDILVLGDQADGVGFTVNPTTYVYTSDRFGRINTEPYQQTAVASHIPDAYERDQINTSPTLDTSNMEERNMTLYRLISNKGGSNPELELVITLEAELATINMKNTTAREKNLMLGWEGTANANATAPYVDSQLGEGDNGVLKLNSVRGEQNLGSLVTAWTIVGTNYSYDCRDNSTRSNDGNQYYYGLHKMVPTETHVVKTYNATTGRVDFVDGGSLDFTRLPIVDGAVPTPETGLYFYAGVEYTFWKDQMGQYVKAERTQGYQFLYGTYADYKVGELGTGTIDYVVTGVNWNGEKILVQPVETIDMIGIAGDNYEQLRIAKKNLGGAGDHSVSWTGNEQQGGLYWGYAYNAGSKDLATDPASVAASDTYNGAVHNPENYWHGQIGMSAKTGTQVNTLDIASSNTTWTITKTDLANGWADVEGALKTANGALLVTPNTKFIVVEGTGSATLNPVVYNGMEAFLNGSDSVVIDVDGSVDSPALNAYFLVNDDLYNNVDSELYSSDANWMVNTVIVPRAAVTWSSSNNLYFSTATAATGTLLANTTQEQGIWQYNMWCNGDKVSVFVDTIASGLQPTPGANGEFYVLTQIATGFNNTPIYKAETLAEGTTIGSFTNDDVVQTDATANCHSNQLTYTYVATNNTSTVLIDGDIYNVSNARVVDTTRTGLADVKAINDAISIGYAVEVSIVNSGRNVSLIYVTSVVDTGVYA